MRDLRKIIFGLSVIVLVFFISACERRQAQKNSADDRTLVQINSYRMTVSDFNDEKKPFLNYGQIQEDPAKLKYQILSQLITRQLLIQEAQRMNLDKDKTFMKEIENYWKQALLTCLLRRKTEEQSQRIVINKKEIEREYALMQRKILVEVMAFKDAESAQRLAGATDDFDAIKQALAQQLVSDSGSEWLEYADMGQMLKQAVFNLKKGQISRPFKDGDYWQVVRILDEAPVQVEPLDQISQQISQRLRREKIAKNLEAWVVKLTKESQIKINPEVFDEVKLK